MNGTGEQTAAPGDVAPISAVPRTQLGKGAARADRRRGMVPVLVYGGDEPEAYLLVDRRQIERELDRGAFMSRLYEICWEDRRERVLPRDIQYHPVHGAPVHADFQRVRAGTTMRILIPVHFTGEEASPGLKRGGVLNVVRHEVELLCLAGAIPGGITVDLSGREINDSIHISDVTLPAGSRAVIRRNFTIATIAPARTEEDTPAETGDTPATRPGK